MPFGLGTVSKSMLTGSRSRANLIPAEARVENERLKHQLESFLKDSPMSKMRTTRQNLPAASQRNSLVDVIHDSRVVIITGMPGCGKSTQVWQG